jgi:peptidoglycan/LPS O-acetylase OafA/YrhL
MLGALVHALLGDLAGVPLLLFFALIDVPALWRIGSLFPLNGPQWSLMFELFANVMHVVLLRRLGERGLMVICAIMGLCFALAIAVYGHDGFGAERLFWWLGIARVGWSYTVGIAMARLYRSASWRPLLRWWQALVLPLLAVLALPWLPLSQASGDALFAIALVPVLFWLLATASPPGRNASRYLEWLGALSFPLYAVHLPVLSLFSAYGTAANSAVMAVIVAILAAGMLVRLSTAVMPLVAGRSRLAATG